MTASRTPDHAPMFDVDVPAPLTLVERLLALAGLYTEHNDRIDLLFAGTAAPAPDAYVSSARRLEREALACVKAVRQQRLPPVEPVPSAVVRLKQTAYLTSGATRYLTSAQQSLPANETGAARLDRRRGFGQHVRQARELTALAPATVVESTTHLAYRLPAKAHARTTVPGMERAQRRSLLMVARGHVAVTGHYEADSHDRSDSVDTDMLRRLDAQGLVTCDAASAPPFYSSGLPRDRVRLTSLGLSVLSTVIAAPLPASPPAARPVPAPATAPSARARR
ncbi:hypothetical protein J7I94_01960 [Streptomyces sp. ISL-12]|uniref:hypothetical protein n=1 Tax=Streptomyces sp. ISL-12 TaxID=2819177 RepID=UPI001BE677CC|nr:hypothetical protein [Streptomyces sp. ISL-12]MBT2409336.1 hypothetical protein [Streptomyces sp. ISL-12]